jgi:hypothetical protein
MNTLASNRGRSRDIGDGGAVGDPDRYVHVNRFRSVVYETGDATIDDAVDRTLDGERLDRTDGLAHSPRPAVERAIAGVRERLLESVLRVS